MPPAKDLHVNIFFTDLELLVSGPSDIWCDLIETTSPTQISEDGKIREKEVLISEQYISFWLATLQNM